MNTYPECRCCGSCCALNVLCMTEADFRAIARYVVEHGVQPRDYAKARCCFQDEDNSCMVWEARAQVCRLHSCVESREDILKANPSLHVDEDVWLVDMHEAFVNGAMDDQLSLWGSWSADGQTPAFLAATRMASLGDRTVSLILERLALKPGMRVLDVGCGSGEYCYRLGSQLECVSFTGIDFDNGFVHFAQQRARGDVGYPYERPNPRNDYRFLHGDAASMPFDAGSFDAVISHTFLTATPNWKKSLGEMRRVCVRGGLVSSVNSMTDDFYGTGTIGLFAGCADLESADLIERVNEVGARAFPAVDLTGGIAPRDVPQAFMREGFTGVGCMSLGHYFCLSDAALSEDDYTRHINLLRLVEEERLARLVSNPLAKAQLPESDWKRFGDTIAARHAELASCAGANSEWNWYGNASLLIYGTV